MTEYPKALYPQGDVSAELQIAADADHEQALRADGYRMAFEQQEEKPVRKRKPKGE